MNAIASAAAPASGLSSGDWIAMAALGFTIVIFLLRELRLVVTGRSTKASQDADQAAAIRDLAKANDRLASAGEKQTAAFADHRLEDVEYHTRTDGILQQLADGHATLARTLENQQGQINNLALGLAPQMAAAEIAATAGRQRRRLGATP